MWCVGRLTEEYRQLMYDLLELYARPFRSREPVVWLDEKSKQLLEDSRRPLPIGPACQSKWTTNTFVAERAICSPPRQNSCRPDMILNLGVIRMNRAYPVGTRTEQEAPLASQIRVEFGSTVVFWCLKSGRHPTFGLKNGINFCCMC